MPTFIKKIEIIEDTKLLLSISSYKSNFAKTTDVQQFKINNITYKYEICEQIDSDISFYSDGEEIPVKLYENAKYWFEFFNIENEIDEQLLTKFLTHPQLNIANKTINGIYTPGNYVGVLNLDIFNIVSNHIEVESRKINYKDEFSKLVEELSEEVIDLISRDTSFHQNMISKSSEINNRKEYLYSSFAYIKSFLAFDKMPLYLSYLMQKPHTATKEENKQHYIWELEDLDVDDLINAYQDESNLFELNDEESTLITNKLPLSMYGRTYYETSNTFENQFIKHILELIYDYLYNIDLGNLSDKFKWEVEQCKLIVGQYLDMPFFKDISKLKQLTLNSKVLQRKYPYNKFLKFFFSWELTSSVVFEMFDESFCMGQKDVPKMYEYYCFMKFVKEFGNKFTLITDNDLFKYQNKTYNFTLISGEESLLNYKVKDDYSLKLYYNKEYKSDKYIVNGRSYSHKLDPDISIELFHKKSLIAILHFDAKYKLSKEESFKMEDLDKMHTYKDAIMGTVASYILYPGKDEEVYKQEENQIESDNIFPSVGAYPLSIQDENIENEMSHIFKLINKFTELADNERVGRFSLPAIEYDGIKRIIG